MPNGDDTNTTRVIQESVGKISSLDAGTSGFRLAAFALMLAFLTALSYQSASHGHLEPELIGGMAVVTLLVLFAPDIARKYLPGGK